MGLFEVVLGIDRAARDTKRRLKKRVYASDPLSAAARAEYLADKDLHDPVEYTHAMKVRQLRGNNPAAAALAA